MIKIQTSTPHEVTDNAPTNFFSFLNKKKENVLDTTDRSAISLMANEKVLTTMTTKQKVTPTEAVELTPATGSNTIMIPTIRPNNNLIADPRLTGYIKIKDTSPMNLKQFDWINETPIRKLLETVKHIKKEPLTIEEENEIEYLGQQSTYLSLDHAKRIVEMKKEVENDGKQDCGYVYSPTTNRFVSNNNSLLNHPPPPQELQKLHIGQMQTRQQKYSSRNYNNNFNNFRDFRDKRQPFRKPFRQWGQPDYRFGERRTTNDYEPKILAKRGYEELSPSKIRPVPQFRGKGGSVWVCQTREEETPSKKTRQDINNNVPRF